MSSSVHISAFPGAISSPEPELMKFVRTYPGSLSSALDKSWSMTSQVSRKKRKSYCMFDLISSGTRNSTHFCVAIETSALKEWPASARFEIKLSIDNDGFSWWVIMHKGIKGLITAETAWVQPGWMLFCSAWFPWSLWELSETHLDSLVMRVRGVCALCSCYQVVQGKYGEYSFS